MVSAFLAFSFMSFFWGVLAFLLVVVCILLIAIILIQDPKGGGLTSAFGAGPGGESLLGARAQKDVSIWTGGLTLALMIIAFLMVVLDPHRMESAGSIGAGESPLNTTEITAPAGEGDEVTIPETPTLPSDDADADAASPPTTDPASSQPSGDTSSSN